MNQAFIDYAKSLGLTSEAALGRLTQCHSACQALCPETLDDILIDEYINENGERTCTDANFFAKNYGACSYNFLTEDRFSVSVLKNKVSAVGMRASNFNINDPKPTEQSRLTVEVHYGETLGADWTLKATRDNCPRLLEVVMKYFKPHLQRQ